MIDFNPPVSIITLNINGFMKHCKGHIVRMDMKARPKDTIRSPL